jgi:hypothetical protein
MRGLLIKHHHMPTVERAYFVQKAIPEVDVFGGVTLNYAVGGLNPFTVDASLKLGGKMVWMPSADAKNHLHHFGVIGNYGSRLDYSRPRIYENVGGITILDEESNLKSSVHEILDVISDANAAIATSHLNVEESKTLVEETSRRKIKTVVTHVGFVTAALSVEEQEWMASKGAYLELCYSSLSPAWRNTSIDEIAKALRKVGSEHYILASDLGQVHNPPAPEGLRIYIMMLLERGFSTEEIRVMVKDNPERILGLD